LDGWRTIAIALVIVAHGFWNAYRPAQKMGALGVNLFFAISGYLICTLLLREQEQTGSISLKGFYTRRFFRILPPAVLYLLVTSLVAALGWITVKANEIPTALFTANYFPDRLWFTAHFWSLGAEEHFYLVWPGLLLLFGRRRVCQIGLVLTAICVIYRPWAAVHLEGGALYQRTDMRIDAFVIPCVLAVLLRQEVWRQRAARWLNGWVLLLLLAGILAGSYAAEQVKELNTFNKLLQAVFLPLIVIAPVFRTSSWLAKVLNFKFMRWVGKLSYGIYLWQEMFLHDTSSTPQKLLLFPLALVAILVCAWLSYTVVEVPLRNLGRRLAEGHGRKRLPASAGESRKRLPAYAMNN
jgi:peptidoglycan/LPS O-acetylase OafA/YrhL